MGLASAMLVRSFVGTALAAQHIILADELMLGRIVFIDISLFSPEPQSSLRHGIVAAGAKRIAPRDAANGQYQANDGAAP